MTNSRMPIFVSQPYIYIANNYENFDCLVKALPAHTWGIRMLFPVWALTGLKFLYPYLVSFPIYVDKTELIQAWVKTEPAEITLFTRPHRFGKTFVMSMLASFFDIRRDSKDLFEGLKIAEDQKLCELWMNQ